ncbi:tripartite tricarboxylate transporter TctB family protein [Methylobacterium sp. C25]|uniref:tripartite tricarboxylate transporter TctB family protein n=1 Tax=Methylobacterium sp. C25 TaxID=2721622 RepID=UPI001F34B163|nr:tripartite tricarboxylate transporter TctB family protein [Methylobacterium sp. C25]MCE4225596.1 tripartite tricarboxylate transporter TctB family protein [Methylobacterium sp. C25]
MNGVIARRELMAGGLLAAIGIGVVVEARRHAIGTLSEMQAGYFPLILGILLIGLGALTVLSGFTSDAAETVEDSHPIDLRGCAAIIASVLAFVLLGEYAGLLPATFLSALIAAAGDRKMTVKGALVLAATLSAVAALLFSYALNMPFPLVRW